jgi:hypothetical protein
MHGGEVFSLASMALTVRNIQRRGVLEWRHETT